MVVHRCCRAWCWWRAPCGSYPAGARRAGAWTEHVRQTRAVDFRLTDPHTGMSAVVKAFAAAGSRPRLAPCPYLHRGAPLYGLPRPPPPLWVPRVQQGGPPGRAEGDGRCGGSFAEARRAMAVPQLMVCKG